MDRNGLGFCYHRDDVSSLSARRAWIEIMQIIVVIMRALVALRKESVDRNMSFWSFLPAVGCRSPQGERG